MLGTATKRVMCAGTVESIKKLVKDLNDSSVPQDVEVVIAPAFIHLYQVLQIIKPDIKVAAQNCWSTHMGAYTGEVDKCSQNFRSSSRVEQKQGIREQRKSNAFMHDIITSMATSFVCIIITYEAPAALHNIAIGTDLSLRRMKASDLLCRFISGTSVLSICPIFWTLCP